MTVTKYVSGYFDESERGVSCDLRSIFQKYSIKYSSICYLSFLFQVSLCLLS